MRSQCKWCGRPIELIRGRWLDDTPNFKALCDASPEEEDDDSLHAPNEHVAVTNILKLYGCE